MAFTANDLQTLLDLLANQPQARTQLGMLLAANTSAKSTEQYDRLTTAIERLTQAQQRTAETQQRTAEAQQRTEERLERLAGTVQALAEAQQRTEAIVQQLVQSHQRMEDWQRGETGRRDGERYERRILRRAPALFQDGQGGSPDEPLVRQKLSNLLRSLLATDTLADEEDPFLADIIWWKNDHFIVAEVSHRLDNRDVIRAARRSETLRRAGLQATAVVIGEDWVAPDTRRSAQARTVEWKVDDEFSEGLLAFRRLAVTESV